MTKTADRCSCRAVPTWVASTLVIRSLITLVYLVVGVVVANGHKYFVHVSTVRAGASAALAVLLWPLVLLGVNLHLH